MKKILLLIAFTGTLFSCSSDDNNGSSTSTNAFSSTLEINGQSFVPDTNTAEQSYEYVINYGGSQMFTLIKNGTSLDAVQSFTITLQTPPAVNQSSTLNLDFMAENDDEPLTVASYTGPLGDLVTATGTVTVTNLGNNKYKFVFSNATMTNENGTSFTLTGSCQGKFTVVAST